MAERPLRPVEDIAREMRAGGFDDAGVLPDPPEESRFKDHSVVVVCPTRGGIDPDVVEAWNHLVWPMNHRRAGPKFTRGWEVSAAYNELVAWALAHFGNYRYLVTLEDDNIPPRNAILTLIETLEYVGLDACSGLYHTKTDPSVPLALGDPFEFQKSGVFEARPIDLSVLPEDAVVEVNVIPMGCAVWKLSMFKEISAPWFVNVPGVVKGADGVMRENETHDAYFCRLAKTQHGKRFGVDTSIRVVHRDVSTGRDF